jgi:hypothetical protein
MEAILCTIFGYRFLQKVVLICEQVEELILGLENIDPHYKIIGYVSTDTTQRFISHHHYVKPIDKMI